MVAMVVGGWNFFVRDTEKLTGVLKMKMEQLKLVGYEPILIEWFRWARFARDEKLEFIQNSVQKALSEK
jgi:hypothetical protein